MAVYSKLLEGLTNGEEHFVKVFTVNHKGRFNNRVDLPWATAIPNEFPAQPTSYSLIGTYTTAQTIEVPEDGWYQIELYGASGNSGSSKGFQMGTYRGYNVGTGGGGGGGGCAISRVKLNKGDTIVLSSIDIGSTVAVYINSSLEIYANMLVTSGGNGGNGAASSTSYSAGSGGTGGVASGGNYSNADGSAGGIGAIGDITYLTIPGGTGGTSGHTDGNAGATAQSIDEYHGTKAAVAGKTAFMKIYRGNTNIVA